MRIGFAGICLAGCLVTTSVRAEDTAILVTGRVLPDAIDATVATRVLEADTIDSEASGRIETLLKQVDGLTSFRRSDARSAHPTSGGVTLRGLGGNAASRVLVTLDGVPQADPFGGWVNWTTLDILPAHRIALTRGGGGGIDGAGALAGTIALTTTDSDDTTVRSAFGSRHSALLQGSGALSSGGSGVRIGGRFERSDGFVPIAEGGRGAVDRAAPYRQWGVAAGASGDLGVTELRVIAHHSDDRRDRGTDFTTSRIRATDWAVQWGNRGESNSCGWQLSAYGKMHAFRSSFAAVSAGRASASRSLDQFSVPATGLGLRGEWRPAIGERATLRLGLDAARQDGATHEDASFVAGRATRRRVAGGVNATLGAFADAAIFPSDRWTLTLGGRIDRWQIAQGFRREVLLTTGAITDERFAARTGTEVTGRAGLAWHADPDLTLRASAYRGWRLPTLNELYRPFRAGADATAANAALKTERLDGAEAGLAWRRGPWRLDVTGYVGRLERAIANVTSGAGPGLFPGVGFVGAGGAYRVRENLDAIDTRGVEIDAGWHGAGVAFETGAAWTDARVRGGTVAPGIDDNRPAQVPRWTAHARVAADLPRDATVQAVVRHVAAQFDDDANRNRLAAATTVDLSLSIPVFAGISADLRGENLFDRRVEAAILPDGAIERAAPRTLWLGLRFGSR